MVSAVHGVPAEQSVTAIHGVPVVHYVQLYAGVPDCMKEYQQYASVPTISQFARGLGRGGGEGMGRRGEEGKGEGKGREGAVKGRGGEAEGEGRGGGMGEGSASCMTVSDICLRAHCMPALCRSASYKLKCHLYAGMLAMLMARCSKRTPEF